jgi:hypothetical protein
MIWLLLFREIIDSCSENHMGPIETLYRPTAKYWSINAGSVVGTLSSSVSTLDDILLFMRYLWMLLKLQMLYRIRQYENILWTAKSRWSEGSSLVLISFKLQRKCLVRQETHKNIPVSRLAKWDSNGVPREYKSVALRLYQTDSWIHLNISNVNPSHFIELFHGSFHFSQMGVRIISWSTPLTFTVRELIVIIVLSDPTLKERRKLAECLLGMLVADLGG